MIWGHRIIYIIADHRMRRNKLQANALPLSYIPKKKQVESSDKQKPEAEKEDFGLLPIMYKLVSCCLLFIGCLNPLWSLPVLDSREEPLQLSGKMISFPYVSLERVFKGLKCNVRDKNEYSFLKESCEINSSSYEKNSEGPYNTS